MEDCGNDKKVSLAKAVNQSVTLIFLLLQNLQKD